MALLEIALSLIDRDPDQPRRTFRPDDLEELAESIKKSGQLVPVIVVATGDRYQLVDGECRFRAAPMAGLTKLRAEVLDKKPTRAELMVLQLVVNAQRTNLSALEELDAYESLMQELKCNATELAQRLSVSKAKVTRILSLRSLSDEERQLVQSGKLSSANAYALSRMDEGQRNEAMREISQGTFTREKAERLSSTKGKAVVTGQKSVQLQFGDASLRISTPNGLSLDAILNLFDDVVKELKRARKDGLDVATAVHVLRDRSRPTEAGVMQ
jgi:ParB family chromosome partitioning protein